MAINYKTVVQSLTNSEDLTRLCGLVSEALCSLTSAVHGSSDVTSSVCGCGSYFFVEPKNKSAHTCEAVTLSIQPHVVLVNLQPSPGETLVR